MIRIEGMLNVTDRGVFRFAFTAAPRTRKIKGVAVETLQLGGMLKSNPIFDTSWDINMRDKPLFDELVNTERQLTRMIMIGWKDAIYERFNRVSAQIIAEPTKRLYCKVGGGYVEFVQGIV